MSMERYFLRPTPENSNTPVLEVIDSAFNNEETLNLAGEREGVAINLGLTVTRLTKTRSKGGIALRFSGVVQPDQDASMTGTYTADVVDSTDPDALVQVEVRPRNK